MLLPSIFKNNFDDFFNGFDDFFNFPSITRVPASRWMTTNVKDLGSEYELEIELPGYDKSDVSASLDKGYLTVSANKEETKDDDSHKNSKYIRKERYSGSCKRSFYVGDSLKEEDFKASFENGVLTIIFPKNKQVAKEDEKKYISIK
jgi:HSP20 family molecular chaperone IbpA